MPDGRVPSAMKNTLEPTLRDIIFFILGMMFSSFWFIAPLIVFGP